LSLFLIGFCVHLASAGYAAPQEEVAEYERKGEFQNALKVMELHKKEFSDDFAVSFRIADYLFYGRKGVETDKPRARELYAALVQSLTGVRDRTPETLYMTGIAVSNAFGDTASAFKYLLESAENGYPPAEAEVAFRYMKGIGVKMNVEQAAQWAKKATAHDNAFGQAIYGAYLLIVRKQKGEGFRLIQKSADAGNPGGQYMLFHCLYDGCACEKNREKSMQYLELSADQGFPDAVSKLQILRTSVSTQH